MQKKVVFNWEKVLSLSTDDGGADRYWKYCFRDDSASHKSSFSVFFSVSLLLETLDTLELVGTGVLVVIHTRH